MDRKSEYLRLRRKGWAASNAWDAAKVNVLWELLLDYDAVLIDVAPDQDPHAIEPDWLGCYDNSKERERAKAKWWHEVENEGVWIFTGQYLDEDGRWITVDSCGGFVGSGTFKDSGDDVDIKRAVIKAMNVADESYGHIERTSFPPGWMACAYSNLTMHFHTIAGRLARHERRHRVVKQ